MDFHNNRVIKVNMNLPIHITDTDAQENPGFINLLTALSQHVKDDGTSKQLDEAFKQSKEILERERLKYLQQHILHHELHQLLMEHSIASHDVSPDSKTAQFYDAVQDCLAVAEACDYLAHSEGEGAQQAEASLLGLGREQLLAGKHQKKMVSVLQPQLIPLMEERLRKRCEEIQSFHETDSMTSGEELSLAKATQLADILHGEKMKAEEERRQLRLARLLRNKQCWQYYQSLKEALETLEKLIMNHRLRLQADSDSISTDWLSARCQAMHLKIRVFEAKLLCSTYTPDVIRALSTARKHLEEAVEECETDLTRHSQALASYETLGMGFSEIVSEYQELRAAIDNKKWALRELKQSLAEETTEDFKSAR